jgi:hypothetical protein
MQSELRGTVPKLPWSYTLTLINRAWREVREKNLWSFNLIDWAWISPQIVTSGTANLTQGSASLTFDATAIAALNASQVSYPTSLITQRQLRGSAAAGIYNIIAYNPITGAATLDRIYADPGSTTSTFQVYQVYYTAPVRDFMTLKTARNMSMYLDMIVTRGREWVDSQDPQRSWYQFPTHVVAYKTDTRGAGTVNQSATLGYAMFELWGQPVSPFVYQCYGLRRGVDMTDPNDTLPYSISEELVLAKARMFAYEWAEGNKDMAPRAAGPDFKFLMAKAADDFTKYLIRDRKNDKEFVDNWFSIREPMLGTTGFSYYNTLAGVAGPYGG